MGPSLGDCFHLSRTGHLPFFVWDPHTALYLQTHSSDVTSSTLHLYGYAQTASGAHMSIKQPSQQVQSPFFSEFTASLLEPGETCCVCLFLVIRQRLQALKISIPYLSSSGAESKCYNSCVCICFLWGR